MKYLMCLLALMLGATVGCSIPAIGSGYEVTTAETPKVKVENPDGKTGEPVVVEEPNFVFDGKIGYELLIGGID